MLQTLRKPFNIIVVLILAIILIIIVNEDTFSKVILCQFPVELVCY